MDYEKQIKKYREALEELKELLENVTVVGVSGEFIYNTLSKAVNEAETYARLKEFASGISKHE